MLRILKSEAAETNNQFKEEVRKPKEDNLGWLGRVGDPKAPVSILLAGGADIASLRVRLAQSQARHDLSPSHWSHAALLLEPAKDLRKSVVLEVPLDRAPVSSFPPECNGVEERPLGAFADRGAFPNVALIHLPVKRADVAAQCDRFRLQRAALDAPELVVRWLAFVWGVAKTPNPLLEGYGLPSAAMIEAVLAAAGHDVSPNLPSRSSCPEVLWQAAKWWHAYYKAENRKPLWGAWCVEDDLSKRSISRSFTTPRS
jgi:hypothetical protein